MICLNFNDITRLKSFRLQTRIHGKKFFLGDIKGFAELVVIIFGLNDIGILCNLFRRSFRFCFDRYRFRFGHGFRNFCNGFLCRTVLFDTCQRKRHLITDFHIGIQIWIQFPKVCFRDMILFGDSVNGLLRFQHYFAKLAQISMRIFRNIISFSSFHALLFRFAHRQHITD
ncbi:hypothetical protein SDC9_150010 [bioreactor metagenome]|uniref:Uncharacterized protein n=1 Tax=bioreactor metagenome TaxID=1076179 RepID=A0A645EQI5_9ZZZZ